MEDQLNRIADSFEKIAFNLGLIADLHEHIQMHGLDVNLSGLDNSTFKLEGPLLLQHEFSEKLSIAVCNQKIGSEYYPFNIESK